MEFYICAIVKNEQKYIKEWIEHHLSIGFTHIFIFEDYGSLSHQSITQDYPDVTLTRLDDYFKVKRDYDRGDSRQRRLYQKFINTHKDGWCAFIDIDEFVDLRGAKSLEELVNDFSECPGLAIPWEWYGANGHIAEPEGCVLKNYTYTSGYINDDLHWCFKSFVNLSVAKEWANLHRIEGCVDCDHVYVDQFSHILDRVGMGKLAVLKHFFTRSFESYVNRIERRGDLCPNHRHYSQFFDMNPDMRFAEKLLMKAVDEFKSGSCDFKKYQQEYENLKNKVRVCFCDFWKLFDFEDSYFYKLLAQKYNVVIDTDNPEYVFYSLFGHTHEEYKDAIKICVSGEPFVWINDKRDFLIDLDKSDQKRHFSAPYILLWSDWFGKQLTLNSFNQRISSHRESFCGYLVSTNHPERDEIFNYINDHYKKVDSGGNHLNNIGRVVKKDLVETPDFYKQHKFFLAFENTEQENYITEKIFMALRYGCIPIYWGAPNICNVINPDCFINANSYSKEALVSLIQEIDEDDELARKYQTAPVFQSGYLDKMHDSLSTFIDNIVNWKQCKEHKMYHTLYSEKNNQYIGNACEIQEGIAFASVSKCGCCTLSYLHNKRIGIDVNIVDNTHIKNDVFKHWWENQLSILDAKTRGDKIYCVIRDPRERFISAWKTVDANVSFDEFCNNVVNTFKYMNDDEIDQHLMPQTWHYNTEDIDEFVWIDDLQDFLHSIGCNVEPLNKSEHESYDIPDEVMKIYKCDFDFINSIPKEKIWSSSDK